MQYTKQMIRLLICLLLSGGFVRVFSQGTKQTDSRAEAERRLLVVRERIREQAALDCPAGLVAYGFSYSEISVFAGGRVTRASWVIPPCSTPAMANEWTPPANDKTHERKLSATALVQLHTFLDRPEVRELRDFMNAGPGVGDYDIEIDRPSGVQHIPVISLMPGHAELKHDPTLLQLICKAKGIGHDK